MSENQTSQISSAEAISSENIAAILAAIKAKGWWQGSVIPAAHLAKIGHHCDEAEFWIVISQTCNLYNPSFDKVPVFEVVGASIVEVCSPSKSKGDDPRVIHLQAASNETSIALSVDIQKRKWLPRRCLVDLSAPEHSVKDPAAYEAASLTPWLDNLAGWLARSYTRVALPDDFNEALGKSKLRQVFEEKLAKDKDGLYGIYLSIEPDSDQPWIGTLGLMPPPYALAVTLVVNDEQLRSPIRAKIITQIFEDKIPDPASKDAKVTRSQLALRDGIRIIQAGIDVRSATEITVDEMRYLIRYSMVDHLSNSSFATE